MRIGVPREIKTLEGRVALVPEACADLVQAGHEVFVESGAGLLSGYPDEAFSQLGVSMVSDAATLFEKAELIVKVKEPIGPELELLQSHHILFCFLHLAAAPELADTLESIGATCIAFETVEEQGKLPLLAPMSDIAGRLSVQIGAHLLHQPQEGKGVLLGGVPAAERGRVVIVGGGVAGQNAASMAAAIGAEVTVFDLNRDRLAALRQLGNNVTALYPYHHAVADAVASADLLVGAVLVAGAKAPHVVSAEMVRSMEAGSVIVDISVDQGGCIETTHPTNYQNPTYKWEEVTHFGVTNMPGAVPKTASQALSAVLIPYVKMLTTEQWSSNSALQKGVNVQDGKIVHSAVAAALGK